MAELLAPIDPVAAIGWADALIQEFGSLAATLSASRARLLKTLGGATAPVCALAANRAAMLQALHQRAFDRPVISVTDQLIRYLHLLLAEDLTESFYVLFLDAGHGLITDQLLGRGGVDFCHIEPRTVISRALEVGAVGLILVHNHPSGYSTSSYSDRLVTRRIAVAARHLAITVREHIVISRSGYSLIDWMADEC